MKITRASEYAVRCVIYLSKLGEGVLAKKKEVSSYMEIPDQFLGKIAQNLAKVGIIEIVRGAGGGFRLQLSPDKISLLDVVEAEIGPIALNDCVIKPHSCQRSSTCSVHKIWLKAREQLRNTLSEVSFKQILEDETCFDIFLQVEA
jgi:Rrf2 family protein